MLEQAIEILLKNCPSSSKWSEESFLGVLEDEGRWIPTKYWELEFALYSLGGGNVDKQLLAAVFKIYSRLKRLFSSNRDPNDIYKFDGLDNESAEELEERIELVFEGVFLEKMPHQDLFSSVNPLLS